MHAATEAVGAHLVEIQKRTTVVMDGVEVFLPQVNSLLREISRAEEDIPAAKRADPDSPQTSMLALLQQRHAAIQKAATELQLVTMRLHDLAIDHAVHVERFRSVQDPV